jgi:hypothetical protein
MDDESVIMKNLLSVMLILGLTGLSPATAVAAVPAFPGAEGFGAQTVGGRGGTVCHRSQNLYF